MAHAEPGGDDGHQGFGPGMAGVHCVVVVVVSCCTDLLLHPSRLLSWMYSAKCQPFNTIT